ncbi:N-acetylneuraminate synthase [Oceanihabitans sp. 2_MG-2023]|uniref:N-acetylneuraminate synthase n=1 Tax=Oceanihabitans sp. 2_MG-2023 TaxID=3062661 RepID=UPI0026E149B4|nr:N-acetylneuraminate synthase [Oceanihabitans sp. 2_MG-2023]MDO6595882.1 N-acetylneuraminate synthase [Oceanihabitans sp. 2_MG-2023]
MKKTIIIAEAGVNHNGNFELAKKLIDAAADAGADYVKFQTFKAEKVISVNAKKADYQIENTGDQQESQLEMVKKLELSPAMHDDLVAHCEQYNVKFLSTAFDLDSIDLLSKYKLDIFKIPSGEITNLPYLEKIAKLKFPSYIMSTGMANMEEVNDAVQVLLNHGIQKEKITILHCNTEYPTPMIDVNLKAMNAIKERFGVSVGYSDHTLGIEIPIAAVALGAQVIEKHFTLDREMKGPDHRASLEPQELKQMVTSIRNIEVALGDGVKQPSDSEKKNIVIARKSIIALQEIKEGEIFTEQNLTVKRPGSGISPMKWYDVIGTKASKNYQPDDII